MKELTKSQITELCELILEKLDELDGDVFESYFYNCGKDMLWEEVLEPVIQVYDDM